MPGHDRPGQGHHERGLRRARRERRPGRASGSRSSDPWVPRSIRPAIGNEVLAHADNLTAGQAARDRPAVLPGRRDGHAARTRSRSCTRRTPAAEVLLPDCVNGALPAGLFSCVVRPATRTADNTFVSVLTTTTSRWRLRRGPPVANQGAADGTPGAHGQGGCPVRRLRPARSAGRRRPPSGAGPVAAYRVSLDGAVVSSPAGTSVVVKDPGPGAHTITRGRGQRRGSGSGGDRDDDGGGALQAAQGQRGPGQEGRQADSRREVEGARGRRRLRHQQVQGRGVQGRTARRSTPRSSRPAS